MITPDLMDLQPSIAGMYPDPYRGNHYARTHCEECLAAQSIALGNRGEPDTGWERARCSMHRNSVPHA